MLPPRLSGSVRHTKKMVMKNWVRVYRSVFAMLALMLGAVALEGAGKPPKVRRARVTVAMFDLAFHGCSEFACDSFLVIRFDDNAHSVQSASHALVHLVTLEADRRLDPMAIERNPAWEVDLVRDPACDRPLSAFPQALVHILDGRGCEWTSQFSSVPATVSLRVEPDEVLPGFTLVKLRS